MTKYMLFKRDLYDHETEQEVEVDESRETIEEVARRHLSDMTWSISWYRIEP